MQIVDRLRAREIEQIVVAAQLAIPGVEARPAEAGLIKPQRLDHRAHGAVEHENALRGELAQLGFDWRDGEVVHGIGFHAALRICCGRRPSRWQIA